MWYLYISDTGDSSVLCGLYKNLDDLCQDLAVFSPIVSKSRYLNFLINFKGL